MGVIKNITTSPATTTLISRNEGYTRINSISVSNFSDNADGATVNIYFKTGATDLYLIKNCVIPKGASLILDNGYYFPNNLYGLVMYSTGTAPALTVIID